MFTMNRSSARMEIGQGLVEYALILVLVAIVALAITSLLGKQIEEVFCQITLQLDPDSTTNACVSPIVKCLVESTDTGEIVLQAVVSDPDGTGDIEETIDNVVFYEDGDYVRTEYWYEYCLGSGNDCTDYPYSTSSGKHTYTAVATDKDDNTGQCSVTVTIP